MNKNKLGLIGFNLLMGLVFFQGISGLFGGAALMLDPTGQLLQMPLSLLARSPFNDYLVPGIILFVILGVFPLIVWYGLWKRQKWSWFGTLLVSVGLIIWIEVEIVMVGYQSSPPLQLIYGTLGILLMILVFLPPVKNTLGRRRSKF